MALAESSERSAPAAPPAKPPNFRAERKLFRDGFLRVAGVDEAGRGPLAGPVVAAAVVLNPKRIPKGIADSKILEHGRARADLRGAVQDSGNILRLRLGRRDRPRQHPAGDAPRHAPRRAWSGARARCRADRRQHRAAGDAVRGAADRGRRREMPVDRRSVDRRQGDPRPPDDPLRFRLCRLRARLAQGLFHQAAPGSARRARPLPASPPQLLARGRVLRAVQELLPLAES